MTTQAEFLEINSHSSQNHHPQMTPKTREMQSTELRPDLTSIPVLVIIAPRWHLNLNPFCTVLYIIPGKSDVDYLHEMNYQDYRYLPLIFLSVATFSKLCY